MVWSSWTITQMQALYNGQAHGSTVARRFIPIAPTWTRIEFSFFGALTGAPNPRPEWRGTTPTKGNEKGVGK